MSDPMTKPIHLLQNIAAGQESAAEVIDAWVIGREERAIYDPNNPVMSHFTRKSPLVCASILSLWRSMLTVGPQPLYICIYHRGSMV